MTGQDQGAKITNRLLAGMGEDNLRLLRPFLHRQSIKARHYLQRRGQPLEEAHFIESGVVSLIVDPRNLGPLEIGTVGQEGLIGAYAALIPGPSFHDCLVQVDGTSMAITIADLGGALEASATLREYLYRYLATRMIQLGETTYANGRAKVQQKLARWLLMYQDRLCTAELPLTHESMSLMLGVRRASVTTALHGLEAEGWLRTHRGTVIVRDRAGLEQYCSPFYGRAEAAYELIMGHASRPPACPRQEAPATLAETPASVEAH